MRVGAAQLGAPVLAGGAAALGTHLNAEVEAPLGWTVAYQWYQDGQVIEGKRGPRYAIGKGDLGKRVWVSIVYTATDASERVVRHSNSVAVAKAKVKIATKVSHTKAGEAVFKVFMNSSDLVLKRIGGSVRIVVATSTGKAVWSGNIELRGSKGYVKIPKALRGKGYTVHAVYNGSEKAASASATRALR
jgi:hypothetical protein